MRALTLLLIEAMLCACGAANAPSNTAAVNQPAPPANAAENSPKAANESRRKFEVPDSLPQPEETPLYKLVAREYFAMLGKFDLDGLRRTLSQAVQDNAGAALKKDIDAMREQYTRITFEEVSWEAKGEGWVCTFNQTLHPKSGHPEIDRDQKIYLVKDRGRWVVEQ